MRKWSLPLLTVLLLAAVGGLLVANWRVWGYPVVTVPLEGATRQQIGLYQFEVDRVQVSTGIRRGVIPPPSVITPIIERVPALATWWYRNQHEYVDGVPGMLHGVADIRFAGPDLLGAMQELEVRILTDQGSFQIDGWGWRLREEGGSKDLEVRFMFPESAEVQGLEIRMREQSVRFPLGPTRVKN